MALAGAAGGPNTQEAKPPRSPPALFPKSKVEEPGKFPCLRMPPIDRTSKELITLQRGLKAIMADAKYPYHLKPSSDDYEVERFSDAQREQDEQAILEFYVHSRSAYLPRQIRGSPLVHPDGDFNITNDSMLLEGFESVMNGINAPLPTHQPLPDLVDEFAYNMPPMVIQSSTPNKRKRAEEDEKTDEREQIKRRKKGKEKDESPKKKDSASKKAENGSTDLNLDNLAKYKIAELRNFCREKGITANSRTKQGIIDAILAWKEKQPKPKPKPAATTSATTLSQTKTVPVTPTPAADSSRALDVSEAEKVNGDHGKLPRQPVDRISRLALIEENEEGDENEQVEQKSTLQDDEDDDEDNDYNKRYDSEDEEAEDDDDDDEATF